MSKKKQPIYVKDLFEEDELKEWINYIKDKFVNDPTSLGISDLHLFLEDEEFDGILSEKKILETKLLNKNLAEVLFLKEVDYILSQKIDIIDQLFPYYERKKIESVEDFKREILDRFVYKLCLFSDIFKDSINLFTSKINKIVDTSYNGYLYYANNVEYFSTFGISDLTGRERRGRDKKITPENYMQLKNLNEQYQLLVEMIDYTKKLFEIFKKYDKYRHLSNEQCYEKLKEYLKEKEVNIAIKICEAFSDEGHSFLEYENNIIAKNYLAKEYGKFFDNISPKKLAEYLRIIRKREGHFVLYSIMPDLEQYFS